MPSLWTHYIDKWLNFALIIYSNHDVVMECLMFVPYRVAYTSHITADVNDKKVSDKWLIVDKWINLNFVYDTLLKVLYSVRVSYSRVYLPEEYYNANSYLLMCRICAAVPCLRVESVRETIEDCADLTTSWGPKSPMLDFNHDTSCQAHADIWWMGYKERRRESEADRGWGGVYSSQHRARRR